jgi:hypothetical protein
MLTSEQTNEISAALAKAQSEIINPEKNANNSHYKNDYADLATGIKAIRGPLSKHGISFIQAERLDGDILFVETRLSHSSGQWFQGEHPAIKFPARPQEIGSAITYARRYSLFSMVGIAGDDDDGEAANKVEIKAAPQQAAPKPQPLNEAASQDAFDILIETLAMAKSINEIDKWRNDNIETITRLTTEHKNDLRNALKLAKTSFEKKEAA